jgi:hypothetical protein
VIAVMVLLVVATCALLVVDALVVASPAW